MRKLTLGAIALAASTVIGSTTSHADFYCRGVSINESAKMRVVITM